MSIGPWYASNGIVYKDIRDTAYPVAEIDHWAEDTEVFANLIAAAPDMYEGLHSLVKYASTEPGPIPEELWKQAEIALRKAEGKE